ncbi:MAG: cytidine deaminase [Chthonomonadaceae bacterium]|nr:cytidine deaminase [Chthonomonadaceae bacterium]
MTDLIELSREARRLAYAPYSNYKVGAAVLGVDGKTYTGCNVENVSFGLTVCAERTAVVKMVSAGCQELLALAVATADGGTPCGMCLQVLLEFTKTPDQVKVTCVNESFKGHTYTLTELIPHGFASQL